MMSNPKTRRQILRSLTMGGAIVGAYADEAMFAALKLKLEPLGIKVLKPQII